jgi:hypothetical protein
LGGTGAEVACLCVGAARSLEGITDSIVVRIFQTFTVAAIGKGWVGTGAVVEVGIAVEVAGPAVRASQRQATHEVARGVLLKNDFGIVVACELNGASSFLCIANVIGIDVVTLAESTEGSPTQHDEGYQEAEGRGGAEKTIHVM